MKKKCNMAEIIGWRKLAPACRGLAVKTNKQIKVGTGVQELSKRFLAFSSCGLLPISKSSHASLSDVLLHGDYKVFGFQSLLQKTLMSVQHTFWNSCMRMYSRTKTLLWVCQE